MKTNNIKFIKKAVSKPYYKKYLSMIAAIDKYNFYVGHDIDLNHVRTSLKIPTNTFKEAFNASSKVSVSTYAKIANFINHSYHITPQTLYESSMNQADNN